MDLHLRPAGVEDHAFLERLNREAYEELVTRQYGSWEDASQRARFARKLQSLQFRIVLLGDQPVGAIASTEHEGYIFLNELLILPEFQNRGIGSRILAGELRRADVLGKPVRLHTLRMNRAQELYRRYGFIETGRDENYLNLERAASHGPVSQPMDAEPMVREARIDEVGVLLEILLRAYREYEGRLDPPSGVHSETVTSIRGKLAEGGALVCEVGGVAAGCVFYAPEAECLYVGRLAVVPEYRRRGIGDLLLRASERRAGALGFARVRLGVRVALGKLRAYYQARGYIPIAFRSHVGYTEATYVVMEKALEPGVRN